MSTGSLGIIYDNILIAASGPYLEKITQGEKYMSMYEDALKQTSSIKNWKKLAYELNLAPMIIENIEYMYGSNVKNARSAILREWIETSDYPYMRDLGEAIYNIGSKSLAKSIINAYEGVVKVLLIIRYMSVILNIQM